MSTAPNSFVSPDEYLERERHAQSKSEYPQGEIFAMSGASRPYVLLEKNLLLALDRPLQGKGCEIYGSNMRVRVSPVGLYTYPDLSVTCGEEQFADAETDTLLNPLLMVEILSKNTSSYDRGESLKITRTIPSFQEYLTVAQDRVQVEHWERQKTGQWLLTVHSDAGSTIPLLGLGIQIPLVHIYRGAI